MIPNLLVSGQLPNQPRYETQIRTPGDESDKE